MHWLPQVPKPWEKLLAARWLNLGELQSPTATQRLASLMFLVAASRSLKLPIPQHAPFTIGYTFENNPHHYLPDVVGTLSDGKLFIVEAGMEDDKRKGS